MKLKREPVVLAMLAYGMLSMTLLAGLVVWKGVDPATAGAIAAVLGPVGAVIGLVARQYVTPMSDPRDAYGKPLK